MKKQALRVTLPICATIIVAGAWLAHAGPPVLNPPAGPVGVSGRFGTRTAISSLPFTITQCGSYFLTRCLTGVAGQSGITINADDVALNLNGFALTGVAGSLNGIMVVGGRKNLVIKNGSVSNWGASGVNATSASNSFFEKLWLRANTARGLETALGCTIRNCNASNNTTEGIVAQASARILNCMVRENGGDGLNVRTGSTITHCTARANSRGIFAAVGSTIIGCTAFSNSTDGIVAEASCTVTECTVRENVGDGINAAGGCTVSRCTAWANSIGILIGNGCTVSNCTAGSNTVDGIVGNKSVISACTCDGNLGDGIEVASGCVAIKNSCDGNGPAGASGAGIHITGSDNRIEGNNATNNDRGFDFGFPTGGTNNIVIKNTARNNVDGTTLTNYKFPLGVLNTVGEILNFTSGGGVLTATNSSPWANFEF